LEIFHLNDGELYKLQDSRVWHEIKDENEILNPNLEYLSLQRNGLNEEIGKIEVQIKI